ncbi:MAG: APC family permease [Candidatus Binatus sp.]|uniref:APC family permease n=1 Tax=Candidatus Binatus sp. TaxID=2811406 RepID=UPI00272401B4|nr:APC family permease [Candidatus Binatus sp.]MDO8431398.1 APC family permease [Candidatus Binatus sp.]
MASTPNTGSKPTLSDGEKPGKRTLSDVIIGPPRDVRDPKIFHSLSLVAFLAWVGLGSDGLSSSCYGPEEAFLALGHHQYLAVFLALLMALTVFIISASYSQTIDLFPTGGGGYLVATKLLGKYCGLVSGSALVIDYVLTISISIASGADAIFSFMPAGWLGFKFGVCIAVVVLMVVMNLRGVKESVLSLLPIFIAFIIMHVWLIGYAIFSRGSELPSIIGHAVGEVHASSSSIGILALAVIFFRAYSLGGGTYTGIEAVSNGLPILREPRAETGKRTMIYMAVSLAFIAGGILLSYLLLNVEAEHGKTLNAVMFEKLATDWKFMGLQVGGWIITFALLTEGALLFVAAQTGFVDGPRVLATMASDRWLPRRFSNLSARLVTQDGVVAIGLAAVVILIGTEAKVDLLVVLYAINVFATFTLSQLGMTVHWWTERKTERRWLRKLTINGIGTLFTATILAITLTLKFDEGGWITVLMTGGLVFLCYMVRSHYERVSRAIEQLEADILPKLYAVEKLEPAKRDPNASTAAILVSGFNGLGLATLIAVTDLFKGEFRNVVFIGVGEVDSALLKGPEEVQELEHRMAEDLNEYCQFASDLGLHPELRAGLAPDVVVELRRICLEVAHEFPHVVFFAGKLIFSDEVEGFIGRFLHNHTALELQNWLQLYGFSLVILPVRVGTGSMTVPVTSQAA